MNDKLKPGTKEFIKRQIIYKHNSFHGHAIMMIANCNSILDASTTTIKSKKLAQEIQILAAKLKTSLADRVD